MDEVTADTSKLALVEVVARAIKERNNRSPTGYAGDEALAQSALTAIHESGTHRVVEVERHTHRNSTFPRPRWRLVDG